MIRKAVVSVVGLLFLASSSAFASDEAVLKCKWVAEKKTEGRVFEGKEFVFPVEVEKGFFYYLENGMTEKQKRILAATGKSFKEQLKGERDFTSAGLVCRDEKTGERAVLLYFKE
jgi:hypothetical protein